MLLLAKALGVDVFSAADLCIQSFGLGFELIGIVKNRRTDMASIGSFMAEAMGLCGGYCTSCLRFRVTGHRPVGCDSLSLRHFFW